MPRWRKPRPLTFNSSGPRPPYASLGIAVNFLLAAPVFFALWAWRTPPGCAIAALLADACTWKAEGVFWCYLTIAVGATFPFSIYFRRWVTRTWPPKNERPPQ